MTAAPREAARRIGRNGLIAAAVALAVLAVVAATPQLYGSRVGDAFERLGQAQPAWLWLGALGFLCSLCGSAGAWWSALRLCGGRLGLLQANAYYGTGSLVNTFVPARVGDAARIALYSRALDGPNRLLTTGSAFAAIGAARAVALAALVIAGAAVGAMPLWPLGVLAALVGLAVLAAWRSRDGRAGVRVAHALDAFRALGREPRAGLRVLAWIGFATLGRVGAAAAVAAALGVHSPLAAALIVVPALDVAGTLPLTPGNVGVASAAVAAAMQAHGIGATQALSTGIAFHAVETAVSLLYGSSCLLAVGFDSLTGTRRWLAAAAASSAALALGVGLGVTIVV